MQAPLFSSCVPRTGARHWNCCLIAGLSLFASDLCLAGATPARAAKEKDQGAAAVAEVAQADAKYALLIGINRYSQTDDFSPLSFAVNDANQLAGALKELGYRVTVMTSEEKGDSQPTRTNVVREFKRLADRVTVNDTFLFFFAGHGFSRPGKGSYLATMDTELSDPEGTSIPVELLGTLAGAIQCRQAALVFDACRNAVPGTRQARSGALPQGLASDIQDLAKKERGMAILFGCRAGQFSMETAERQQGLFSYHLVLGLKGKAANPRGEVALATLMDYAQSGVESLSDHKQQPWLDFNGARMILGVRARENREPTPARSDDPIPDSELLINLKHNGGKPISGDAAVRGGTMKGSLTYNGRTPVSFQLNHNFDFFETTVGIDQKTKEDIVTQFSLQGDGQPLGAPVMLRLHDKPQTLSVNVSKVDQLTLIATATRAGKPEPLPARHAWWGRPIVIHDPDRKVDSAMLANPTAVYLSVLKTVGGNAHSGIASFRKGDVPHAVTFRSWERDAPVYSLTGSYQSFRAILGLSMQTREKVEVTFVLEADGKELQKFGPLTVLSDPIDTGPVPVRGVDRLKLRVEAVRPGGKKPIPEHLIAGQAWWAGARLEKVGGAKP